LTVQSSDNSTRDASTRRAYVIAGAAYSALAIILTFPLVLHLSSVVPHDLGDPLLSIAILWWNAHVPWFTSRWWDGLVFYPAHGFLALSDPRLGESLIATPLQWLGCSPVTAYNLTLLATYPLSALAAHWLAFTLTKRHDASAICGLAYGFYPYRIAHLPHLELLASFGMPAALAALHCYRDTRRRSWLVVFAAALVVQGLCSSYYLLFFSILIGLWLLWFIRREDTGALMAIAGAAAIAFVPLIPLAIGYSRVHTQYGLARGLTEVTAFSADLTSLVTTAALDGLWGWTARWAKSEGELFPGATILILVGAGAIHAWRRDRTRDRIDRLSLWLLPPAAAFAAVALCGWAFAPWHVSIGVLKMSSDAPFKPMTLALLAIALWFGASSRVRAAFARRSTLGFYVLAATVLFVCSLGPKPAVAGHQFMYEPPYAWLMRLPIFESIRVPARFGMVAMLALAVAGALVFNRVRAQAPVRRALAAALLLAIVADSWIAHLPLPRVPDFWSASRAAGFDAILELPLGGVDDFAAMYRTIDHQRPTLNGNSGFEPPHYATLRAALDEHDPAALDGLAGRVLIVVDKQEGRSAEFDRFLAATPHVTSLAPDARWAFYGFAPVPAVPEACVGGALPIAAITDASGANALATLTDHDPDTWWATPHAQRTGDSLVVDLGATMHPCAVQLAAGRFGDAYARQLVIETSADNAAWTVAATARMAGLTMKAVLDDPKQGRVGIPFAGRRARFVRLRLDQTGTKFPWIVTDIAVRGTRGGE
jgi:hypothetical protein